MPCAAREPSTVAEVAPVANEIRSATGSSVAVGAGGLVGGGVSEGRTVSVAVGCDAKVALGWGAVVALGFGLGITGVSLAGGPTGGPGVAVGVAPHAASSKLITTNIVVICSWFLACFIG
jgi:hypothetical protein